MISIIAAISENNCIGKDGDLPWHIPEDLQHFKAVTSGKPVIMGRKTWESIPEKYRPLPDRTNIILTRQADYTVPDGVLLFSNIKEAIDSQSAAEETVIIGGAQIYTMAMPKADTLYITHVHQTVDGDTFFPDIDMDSWKETKREDHQEYSFVTYERN